MKPRAFALAIASSLLAVTCSSADSGVSAARSVDGLEILQRALGTTRAEQAFRIEATGDRFEPLQGARPFDSVRVSSFALAATYDPTSDRMRLMWHREFSDESISPGTVAYDEIVTTQAGFIQGDDAVFSTGPTRPMNSSRLAAVQKQQRLLNPHLYLPDVVREQRAVRYKGTEIIGTRSFDVVELDEEPRPVRLFIDRSNGQLRRLATAESDFLLGDVDIRVDYHAWMGVSGVRLPSRVDLRWEGHLVHRETRSAVEVGPAVDPLMFELPQTVPFDPAAHRQGLANEQWFNRGLALPFGGGFVEQTMNAPDLPRYDTSTALSLVEITPDVILLAGTRHHVLAVDTGKSIVVAEPSINDDHSREAISLIEARWPDKPISHVVATHHHTDEIGGVRRFAAIGAAVVAPQREAAFFKAVLERPHEIEPDLLSNRASVPELKLVGNKPLTIGKAARAVQIFRFSSSHAREMLVVCMPGAGLAFNGDLYSPGIDIFIGTPNAPLPEPFRTFAGELRGALDEKCPAARGILGSHALPAPASIETLAANAGG